MRRDLRDERGQTIILFAVLLPLILILTSIGWDAGNWWIHRRHLQTQVDAAVLATVNDFSTCFFDEAAANSGIVSDALHYAGDTTRATVLDPATTTNTQIEGDDRVHIVLNSTVYWQPGDDTTLSPTGDYVDVPDETEHYKGAPDGTPCGSSTIEAKATDDRVHPLVPWLPLGGLSPYPSPKRNARVEIQQEEEAGGMLPIAVPETDPAAVYAIFVDYALDGTRIPIAYQQLMKDPDYDNNPSDGKAFPYAAWVTPDGQGATCISCDLPDGGKASKGTGVVILVSKEDASLALAGKTLNEMCPQNNLIACYAGTAPPAGYDGTETGQGISFIHSYRDTLGTPIDPRLRDVNLNPVDCNSPGDLSAAYYTNDANDCSATVRVKIDFGDLSGANPSDPPSKGGICAKVDSNYGELKVDGVSGRISTWVPKSGWTIGLPFAGGTQKLTLSWSDDTGTACSGSKSVPHSGTFDAPAAVPYASDDNAGPVEYLQLSASGPYGSAPTCPAGGPTVTDANSVSGGGDTPWYCYDVAVGLTRPITLDPVLKWDVPDVLLRTASKGAKKSGSESEPLNGALDCDKGVKLDVEFLNGCKTFYGLNYKKWGIPICAADGVYCWKDISCSEYGPSDLPPSGQPEPAPICVAPKGGTVADLDHGLFLRFENPCSKNWWPRNAAEASDGRFDPKSENYHDWAADPRFVKLIITDESAFSHPNLNEPVKYFAGFYVTGWDITPGSGMNKPHGCYGFDPTPNTCNAPNNDPHPLYGCPATDPKYPDNRDNGDLWGHWILVVDPPVKARSTGEMCDLIGATSPGTCVAVLTE